MRALGYRWALLLAVGASLWPQATFAGPLIGIALTGPLTAVFGATAAKVIVSVISIGLGLLMQFLLAQKPPEPEKMQFAFQQPLPFRIWGVGEARIAGAVMLKEEEDGPLYYVAACGGHKFVSLEQFWINDDRVEIVAEHDKGGNVNGLGDGRYGDGVISLFYRLGESTETSYSAEFPGGGWYSQWTADARGDGQASIGMKARSAEQQEIQRRYPVIPPTPSATWRTAAVFDPRDPSQDVDDPTTWQFSKNAILCLLWHECHNPFGPLYDYDRAILPVIDQWMNEADICDEDVPLKAGGTEKRYEVGGSITTEQDPDVGLQAILAAGDIRIYTRGDGAIVPWCGKFREPTEDEVITDSDISGYYLPTEIPNEEACNSLRVTFTQPDAGYATAECDPYEDEDDQVARGRKYVVTAAYNWVQSFTQSRRLAKREFHRLQSPRRGTIDLRFSGVNASYRRWSRVQSNSIPRLNNHVIENLGSTCHLAKGGLIVMGIVGTEEDIDDWNEEVDEGNAPPVPIVTSSSDLQIPTNVNLVFELLGGSYSVSVSFDEPSRDDLAYEVHWRVADDGTGSPGPWSPEISYKETEAVGGRVELSLTGVPLNTDVEVQVRSIGPQGGPSGWSSTETVSTDTSTVAPASPTITAQHGGSGQWDITFKMPNSANLYGARVYAVITGGGFGSATDQFGLITGSPNSSKTKTKTGVGAGTYDLYVSAENADGAASSPAGPVTVTVT